MEGDNVNRIRNSIRMLRDEINEYTTGSTLDYERYTGVETLHIGLFGQPGSGKSSLLNSLMYAMKGTWRESRWIQTGEGIGGGHTMTRNAVKVAKSVCVIDNKGMGNISSQATFSEMKYQLDGKRGYTRKVDWEHDIPPEDYEQGDCINVVVFVYSAKCNIHSTDGELTRLAPKVALLQGNYPVAVITHIEAVNNEKKMLLKDHLEGNGISKIFHVENITKAEPELPLKYQQRLLEFLDCCMAEGDRNLKFRQQKKEEERKKKKAEEERRNASKWCEVM